MSESAMETRLVQGRGAVVGLALMVVTGVVCLCVVSLFAVFE